VWFGNEPRIKTYPILTGARREKRSRKTGNRSILGHMGGARTGGEAFGTLLWVNIEEFLEMRKIYIYGFWGNGVFGAHI